MHLIVEADAENDLLYLSLSERALENASVKKTTRVGENINLDFDAEGRLLGIEVIGASQVIGESIEEVRLDFLVGVKEAAALIGVQRSNFVRDYADKPGFPTPVTELATGRIWLRSQVLKFVEDKQGRKKAS